jgi:hypothetical protein
MAAIGGLQGGALGALRVPEHPRPGAALVGGLQRRALLDRVGGLPEPPVGVGHHAAFLGQHHRAVRHEVAVLRDVVEDLRPEDEVAAVLPDRHLLEGADRVDRVVVAHVEAVERRLRWHREQRPDLVGLRAEPGEHVVERHVGEDVGVVGEEHLLVLDVLAHPPQPLADRRGEAGVDERDRPVADVGAQQLDVAAPQHEVVRGRLVVVEEVVLDVVGAVAEAEHEVGVPEVRVVAHDVPDQRARADRRHRLGQVGEAVAHPHAVAAAEQHDLHQTTSRCGIGKTSLPPQSRT